MGAAAREFTLQTSTLQSASTANSSSAHVEIYQTACLEIDVTVVDTSGTLDCAIQVASDDSTWGALRTIDGAEAHPQITAVGNFRYAFRLEGVKYVRVQSVVATADVTFSLNLIAKT